MTHSQSLQTAQPPRHTGQTAPFSSAALQYAVELGWAVHPLERAGKHPITPNGLKDASSHPEVVGDWCDAHPHANIGVATGEVSGVVVLDVDGPEGFAALAHLRVPPTVCAETGRGKHLYFQHPRTRIPNSAGRLGPQLDVRGDGGYIIAPPSVHPSGREYRWADGRSPWEIDPAPFPDAFIERLTRDDSQAVAPENSISRPAGHAVLALVRSSRSVQDAATRVDRRVQSYLATVGNRGVGARNQTAFQVAAWLLRDFGLPERSAFAYLAEWNSGNRPPLGQRELAAVFHSAKQNATRPEGCAHASGGRVA